MKLKLATLLLALSLGAGCGSARVSSGTGGTGSGGGNGNGGAAGSAGSAGAGGAAGKSGAGGQAGASSGGAATTDLGIIVEPSDKGAALEQAIKNAQKSVHMTMYLLTNYNIIDALIAQKRAGHDVRVVLNQNFYGGNNGNLNAYNQLSNAGVPVHWAPSNFNYTHEKAVMIDGKQAFIMTMNAAYSSPRDNREYIAVDSDAADVGEAESIFSSDFAGQTATVSGKLVVSPVNSRAKLKALIDNAKKTIDMEAEELSDYAIVGALDNASDRGVEVHIVLATGSTSTAQANAVQNLKSHGVKLVTLAQPYIHAKALVADSTRAYVGSENFTQNSLTNNRELGVIFTKASEVAKVLNTTHTDFSNGTAL